MRPDLTVLILKSTPFSFMTSMNKDDELALLIINFIFYYLNLKVSHCLYFGSCF